MDQIYNSFTILWIDNDDHFIQGVYSKLKNKGYKIIIAQDYKSSIQSTTSPPSLIIMEWRIKDGDASQLMPKLKNDFPSSPVIVVSDYKDIKIVARAFKSGAQDYIEKNVNDYQDLINSIEKAINKKELRSVLTDPNTLFTEKFIKANKDLININDNLRDICESKHKISFVSPISQFGERLINAFGQHMLASGGSLYMVEKDGLRLVHALDPGHAPHFIPFPLKKNSVLDYLMTSGKSVLVQNLNNNPRFITSGWDGYKDDSVLAFPIPDEDGRIVGLLSFHSRVQPQFSEKDKQFGELLTHFTSETLRAVKATFELKNSQERLRLTMEATNDGIWDWNPKTKEIYFSPRWFSMLGYHPDNFPHTYETFQNLLHPDDKVTLNHFFSEKLKNKNTFSFEYRMKTKNESWLWVESRGKVMEWDENGNITRVMGTHSDISERKLAEMELYRHSQALQQSLDGIAISDIDGNIEFINHAWAKMHGYEVDKLIGKQLRIFMKPPQQVNFSNFMNKIKEKNGILIDDEHIAKDGKIFSIRLSASILSNKSSEPVGILLIGRDITEELNLEAQLLQSQKMESIGRLAGGIAHDFNNLLSPILASTQLVMTDAQLNSSNKRRLERVLTAAERASDLTRQILLFSRKHPLEMKNIRMSEIVDGFRKIITCMIREDVDFKVDIENSNGYINADISQIEQILMNLIVNAQDAMPHGGKLTIKASDIKLDENYSVKHPDVKPGHYVMLDISDTGTGMSRRILKQAFEPFYTTKEKSKGTGLGLSTVYGLVKQHDGHIRVFSAKGEGTTFKLYFPKVEKKTKKASKTYTSEHQNIGAHETIMVVEDEYIVRDLVCSVLNRLGYNVLDAQDASHCIDIVTKYDGPIHLLLTDVVMPGMNGKDLYIKLSKIYPDMKVLFMSGYTDDVIIDRGVKDSEVEFMKKPLSVQILARKVEQILKHDID